MDIPTLPLATHTGSAPKAIGTAAAAAAAAPPTITTTTTTTTTTTALRTAPQATSSPTTTQAVKSTASSTTAPPALPLAQVSALPPLLSLPVAGGARASALLHTSRGLGRDDRQQDSLCETARQLVQLEACRDVITQVRPYLFVSGAGPAQTRSSLKAAGITHVVNCSSASLNVRFEDIHYAATWNLLDSKRQPLNQYFYPFIAAVENCCREGGRLLVHCHVGASRSCALAIAYLMWREGLAFVEALQDLKQRRSVCNPNVGFMAQLIELEARLRRQRGFATAVRERHGPSAAAVVGKTTTTTTTAKDGNADRTTRGSAAMPRTTAAAAAAAASAAAAAPLLLVHPVSFVDSEQRYLVSLPAEPLPAVACSSTAASAPGERASETSTAAALDPQFVYVLGVWDPHRVVQRRLAPEDTAQGEEEKEKEEEEEDCGAEHQSQSSLLNPCTYFIWIGARVAAASRDAQVKAAKDAVDLFQSLSLVYSDHGVKSVRDRQTLIIPTPQVVEAGAEPGVLKQLLVQPISDVPAARGGSQGGATTLLPPVALGSSDAASNSSAAIIPPNAAAAEHTGHDDDDDDDDGAMRGGIMLNTAGRGSFLNLQRVAHDVVIDQEPRFSRSRHSRASPTSNDSSVVKGSDSDVMSSDDDGDSDDAERRGGPVEFFQLNEEAVWEHFRIYSYDDLCSRSCVLRDPASAKLYCWVCEDDRRMDALSLIDSFRTQLPQKCSFPAESQKNAPAGGGGLGPFQVEKEHAESAAFLDAFNSGL